MLRRIERVKEKIHERKIVKVTISTDSRGYLPMGREAASTLSSFKKANMMMCMDQMTMLVMLFILHTELLKFHSPAENVFLKSTTISKEYNYIHRVQLYPQSTTISPE